jgi:hypothetical protein
LTIAASEVGIIDRRIDSGQRHIDVRTGRQGIAKDCEDHDKPKGEQRCANCELFEAPSSCKNVDGTMLREVVHRLLKKTDIEFSVRLLQWLDFEKYAEISVSGYTDITASHATHVPAHCEWLDSAQN